MYLAKDQYTFLVFNIEKNTFTLHVLLLWSDCANAQTDLNLRWARKPEDVLSDVAAEILLLRCSSHVIMVFDRLLLAPGVKAMWCFITLMHGKGIKQIWLKFIKWFREKELQRQTTYLRTCAPSEDSNQSEHLRRLIGLFIGRILNEGCNVSSILSRNYTYIILTPLNPTFI